MHFGVLYVAEIDTVGFLHFVSFRFDSNGLSVAHSLVRYALATMFKTK